MPRKKKTDETPPIEPNVDLSSGDEAVSTENIAVEAVDPDVTDVAAETPPALDSESADGVMANIDQPEGDAVAESDQSDVPETQETEQAEPKKRRAVKKADEEAQEDINTEEFVSPLASESNLEESEFLDEGHTLNAGDILATIEEEGEDPTFEDGDLLTNEGSDNSNVMSAVYQDELAEDANIESASTVENSAMSEIERKKNLAQRLNRIRKEREESLSNAPAPASEPRENITIDFAGNAVANRRGDANALVRSQLVAGLNRYRAANTTMYVRIIGSNTYNNEVCAICEPLNEKYRDVIVYIPFSKLDITYDENISSTQRRLLISKACVNRIMSPCITSVDRNDLTCVGDVVQGNARRRREAYYVGFNRTSLRRSGAQARKVVGEGTTIEDVFIDYVTQDGVWVNLFGANVFIGLDDLAYEYYPHAADKFKAGERIDVKILRLRTYPNDRNYPVRVRASVKVLKENKTIERLNKFYANAVTFSAKISRIPGINYSGRSVIALTDAGFNCAVRAPLTNLPYTIGSKVGIKMCGRDDQFAYGDIVRVYDYTPEIRK